MAPWNGPNESIDTEITAGLAESNGSLPLGGWFKVTCGLTACISSSSRTTVQGKNRKI